MSNERAFRGVWIPASIWLNESLSLPEKVMLVEIDSLQHPERGCFKTNKKLAEFFGLTAGRVSQIVKSLEEKGFVRVEQVRQGKQIVERRIFMAVVLDAPLKGSKNSKEGYLENAQNPSKNSKEGYLENAEERGSGLGVQSEGSSLPPEDGKAKGSTEKKSTQLPDDFEPNDTHKRLAKESEVNLDAEVENFKDHHLAKGSKFKDWNRALNTWLRNAGKFNKRSNVHPFPKRSAPDPYANHSDCGGKVYIPGRPADSDEWRARR